LRTGRKISAGRVPKISMGRVASSAGRAFRISATGTPWSRRSLMVVWMGDTTSAGRSWVGGVSVGSVVEGSRSLLKSSIAVTAVGMRSGSSDRTGATSATRELKTWVGSAAASVRNELNTNASVGSAPRFVMRAGAAFVGWVAGSVGNAPLRTSLRKWMPPRASVKTSFGSSPKFDRSDGMRAAGSVISGRREVNAFVGTDARFKSLIRVGTVPKTSVKILFGSVPRPGNSDGILTAGSVNPGRREFNISVGSARPKSLIEVGTVSKTSVETTSRGGAPLSKSLTKWTPPRASVKTSFGSSDGIRAAGSVI
jgi:hypothetical protein